MHWTISFLLLAKAGLIISYVFVPMIMVPGTPTIITSWRRLKCRFLIPATGVAPLDLLQCRRGRKGDWWPIISLSVFIRGSSRCVGLSKVMSNFGTGHCLVVAILKLHVWPRGISERNVTILCSISKHSKSCHVLIGMLWQSNIGLMSSIPLMTL